MKQLYSESEIKLVNGYGHEDEVFDKTLMETLPNGAVLRHKADNSAQERSKRTKPRARLTRVPIQKDTKAFKPKHRLDDSHKRHVEKSLTSR